MLIVKHCQHAGLPAPTCSSDPRRGVTVVFQAPEVTPEVAKLIRVLNGEMFRRDLQAAIDIKDNEHFKKAYLNPGLNAALIEMTIPDKPNSSKQRCRLTPLGKKSSPENPSNACNERSYLDLTFMVVCEFCHASRVIISLK